MFALTRYVCIVNQESFAITRNVSLWANSVFVMLAELHCFDFLNVFCSNGAVTSEHNT